MWGKQVYLFQKFIPENPLGAQGKHTLRTYSRSLCTYSSNEEHSCHCMHNKINNETNILQQNQLIEYRGMKSKIITLNCIVIDMEAYVCHKWSTSSSHGDSWQDNGSCYK